MANETISSATFSSPKPTKILLTTCQPPLFKPLLPLLKIHLRLCKSLGGATVPFEWDEEKGKVRLLQSKRLLLICKAQMGVHLLYTVLMTGYFLSPGNLRSIKSSTRMVGLAFLVCFGATLLLRIALWQRKAEVVQLLNNFILFEDDYLPECQPSFKGDKVSRALMHIGVVSSLGLPGLMFTILLVSPCRPPHLVYILFKEGIHGEGCSVPDWPIRIGFLLFDTWVWFHSMSAACFGSFQIFFPGLKCLSFYIQLVNSIFRGEGGPLFQSRSTQDRFCFHVYSHLRVLGKLYNFCLQSLFIPTQITAACSVIIIGLYTCIKLHSQIPMPGFAFFPLLSLDGFAIIFVSNVAAGVYIRSKSFIEGARKSQGYKRRTWFRKMARASYLIKIRFGSTNYIDQMTPLVYMNFCLTQTVSITMLT